MRTDLEFKEMFKKYLEQRDYKRAYRLSKQLYKPSCCFYLTYHIDRLIATDNQKDLSNLLIVFNDFGLECYIDSVHK